MSFAIQRVSFLTDQLYKHAFLKGRSASTRLVEFVNRAIEVMESGAQIDAVYTDIQKVFDRERNSYIIKKFSEMGFHSDMLGWIQLFFSNQQHMLNKLGRKSRSFTVTSGVLLSPVSSFYH